MELQKIAHVAVAKVILVAAALFLANGSYAEEGETKFYGTYSSLAQKDEGDVIGYELLIIPTSDGPKVVIQRAVGEIPGIYVVPINKDGRSVSFDVPLPGGKIAKFAGTISGKGIDSQVKYQSGSVEHFFLKRSRSFWDK